MTHCGRREKKQILGGERETLLTCTFIPCGFLKMHYFQNNITLFASWLEKNGALWFSCVFILWVARKGGHFAEGYGSPCFHFVSCLFVLTHLTGSQVCTVFIQETHHRGGKTKNKRTPWPRPGGHSRGGADFRRFWPEGAGGGAKGQDIELLLVTQLLLNEALADKRTYWFPEPRPRGAWLHSSHWGWLLGTRVSAMLERGCLVAPSQHLLPDH